MAINYLISLLENLKKHLDKARGMSADLHQLLLKVGQENSQIKDTVASLSVLEKQRVKSIIYETVLLYCHRQQDDLMHIPAAVAALETVWDATHATDERTVVPDILRIPIRIFEQATTPEPDEKYELWSFEEVKSFLDGELESAHKYRLVEKSEHALSSAHAADFFLERGKVYNLYGFTRVKRGARDMKQGDAEKIADYLKARQSPYLVYVRRPNTFDGECCFVNEDKKIIPLHHATKRVWWEAMDFLCQLSMHAVDENQIRREFSLQTNLLRSPSTRNSKHRYTRANTTFKEFVGSDLEQLGVFKIKNAKEDELEQRATVFSYEHIKFDIYLIDEKTNK